MDTRRALARSQGRAHRSLPDRPPHRLASLTIGCDTHDDASWAGASLRALPGAVGHSSLDDGEGQLVADNNANALDDVLSLRIDRQVNIDMSI